jgi:hypothetical protein
MPGMKILFVVAAMALAFGLVSGCAPRVAPGAGCVALFGDLLQRLVELPAVCQHILGQLAGVMQHGAGIV